MLLAQQAALIERLIAWRHIESGVLIEEIDRLQVNLQNLTGHDGKVFDPGNVVDAGLYIHHQIWVLDVLIPLRPGSDTSSATRLVRV